MTTEICKPTGKLSYTTRERAWLVSQSMANRTPSKKRKRTADTIVFKCTHCQHFHIGHQWHSLKRIEGNP